jgi:tripartite-type tricarboxylate transporter receptor subunit TctC
MTLPRRALPALAMLMAAGQAVAAEPAKRGETTLLVGAEAGTTTDLWAGAFVPFLERHARRAGIRIANRPGQGGLAAALALTESPPDGRVIGTFTLPALVARAVETGQLPLLRRLRPAGSVCRAPLVLVAPPGTTLEVLAAEPQRGVLALPQAGSTAALAADLLTGSLPLDPLHFPGPDAARQATLAGHAAAGLLALPDVILAIREDRLVALGLAEAERASLLPEVPTLSEAGLPLVAALHRSLLLPGAAAESLVSWLSGVLGAVVADPEFQAQAAELGYLPEALDAAGCVTLMADSTTMLQRQWELKPWSTPKG